MSKNELDAPTCSAGFWSGFRKGYLRGYMFCALIGIVWGMGFLLLNELEIFVAIVAVFLWLGLAFFFIRMKDPTDKAGKP